VVELAFIVVVQVVVVVVVVVVIGLVVVVVIGLVVVVVVFGRHLPEAQSSVRSLPVRSEPEERTFV
jgi:fatty acid desaturase